MSRSADERRKREAGLDEVDPDSGQLGSESGGLIRPETARENRVRAKNNKAGTDGCAARSNGTALPLKPVE